MNDEKLDGLAHFTEHMLFLGSKRYPNVTFFNDLITTNEGHFNGFTDKDTTTFIYEINKEKFQESLDVFLNFFVKPLFKSEHVEKEVFAVNSEFEKNIHSEEKRFDRLFQSYSNPLHPFNRFSTGNKETLRPSNLKLSVLRDYVIKYFHKHYIGRNIKVVVYANYELNYIQNLLIKNLHQISNHNQISNKDNFLSKMIDNGKTQKELEIFTEKEKGKIIFYKSRYKTLKIFFIMKDYKNDLKNNPKAFFKKIFAMRYKQSLLETLIRHRLIFNLRVDFKNKYNNLSAIYFNFLLTEHGYKNVDIIIRLLSRFIKVVHSHIQNEQVFNHIKNFVEHNFNKQPPVKKAYKNLKKWTKNFYLFGKENFITADNLLQDYNPHVLHEFIKNMTLHNSLIFVGSRSFKHFNDTYLYKVFKKINDEEKENSTYVENDFLKNKEKWYKTKYTDVKLDHDHIWHIFKRKFKSSEMSFPKFDLVESKPKIKDSLCKEHFKKKTKKSECRKLFKNDINILQPSLIYKSNNSSETFSEIYYKLDRTHLKKSFAFKMKIEPPSNFLNLNLEHSVPYIEFLTMYLNFLYSEIKLDSDYTNNFYNNHVKIKFLNNFKKPSKLFISRNSKEKLTPYDYMVDSIHLDLTASSEEAFEKSDILAIIKSVLIKAFVKKDFLYLKEELYRNIEFYKSSNPSHQALNWLYRLGFKYDINYFNMTHIIKKIKFDDINKFKENFFFDVQFTSLAVGTITEYKAKEYIKKIEKTFTDYIKEYGVKDENERKIFFFNNTQTFMQAPYTKYGSKFIFQQNNIYKHSPDSTTLNVYFIGENSIYNIVNIKMINSIAGNIFFSYLRIKHQLGYSVKNKLLNIDNNLMFYVHVQGSKKHPSYVHHYIDKVITNIKTKVNKMDDKIFDKIKESVFNSVTHVSSNLNKKKLLYWSYIMGQENIFNRNKLKEYLDRLSMNDLCSFLDKMLDRKLSIQVANLNLKSEKIDKESIYIKDINYFREFSKFGNQRLNEKETENVIVKPILELELKKSFKNINQLK